MREFRLQRPPFWSTRFLVNVALLLMVGWWLAGGAAEQAKWLWPVVVAAAIVLAGIALVRRWLQYRAPAAPIRVRPEGLELPKSVGHSRTFLAPWKDVHTLELRGSTERIVLLLGTKRKTYVLPGELFDQPDAPAVLHAAIVEQIVRQPGGAQVLETMRRGREGMRALVEMRPKVTHALLIAIVVAYGIQTLLADVEDPTGMTTLIRLGGNVSALVAEGQIDRLVTANFLHAPLAGGMGIMHIGLNALALWMLGGLMERLLGGSRFFIIYIVSAIGGAAASAYGTAGPVSVGASTGVLGVFGSLAVVHLLHLKSIPPAVRQPTRWWIVIIGINAVLGLAVPNIDQWGHGGGLVAGMLSTFVLTLGWPPLGTAPHRQAVTRIVALGLLVVTIAGISVSGWRAAFGRGTDLAVLGAQVLDDPEAGPEEYNYFAWMIAIHPSATGAQLETAHRLAQRANEEAPDRMEIVDTLAQTEWRLGNVDRAIELERQALFGAVEPTLKSHTATQLARFLERRVKESGPIVIGEPPELSFDVRNDVLHTEMRGEPPRTGLVAYVVVERGDPLPWLIEVRLGPDARPPEAHELDESWPEGMRAHVALVDSTVEIPRGERWRVIEHPPDDAVASFP